MEKIRLESLDALKYDQVDIKRPRRDASSLISEVDGKWLRGWNDSPLWLNYGLIYKGSELPISSSRHPETINFLNSLKGDIFMAGYSLLKAGGEIETHIDEEKPNNKRNIWHIGLDVPDNCHLILNGEKIKEENRKIIQFDDSINHGAENMSNKDRLILYIKFY